MKIQEKWNTLCRLLPEGSPVGATFQTEHNFYYYDTPTGKILRCNPLEYQVVNSLLSNQSQDFFAAYSEEAISEALDHLINAVQTQDILRFSAFPSMNTPEDYEDLINNHLHQMTLELTQRCNLRCGYCIYHEGCNKNRSFGSEDMTRETAFQAIEYAKNHSSKEETLHIGFYGGEPLLCYPLLLSCIHYALELMPDKRLYFAFTTNAVLLDEQMAAELSRIENISITVSLDGPKEYHDSYRTDLNGGGSFDATIRGMKLLADAFGYEQTKNHLLLNMVYAPPYSVQKLEQIQEFLDSLTWMHPDCNKYITYPDPESDRCIEEYARKSNNPSILPYLHKRDDSMYQYTAENPEKNVFTSRGLREQYLRIYNRTILDQAHGNLPMNGCCVPGQRKIYVSVNGTFSICEKVGDIPFIGKLSEGINVELVKKIYLEGYTQQSLEQCQTCWIGRLCGICYSRCYNSCGFDAAKKAAACSESRNSLKQSLISYFTRLEQDPHVFDQLSEFVVQ